MARRPKGMGKQPGHYAIASGTPQDHKPAFRKCLGVGCEVSFWSLGPGLRKCPKCLNRERVTLLSRAEATGPLKGASGG